MAKNRGGAGGLPSSLWTDGLKDQGPRLWTQDLDPIPTSWPIHLKPSTQGTRGSTQGPSLGPHHYLRDRTPQPFRVKQLCPNPAGLGTFPHSHWSQSASVRFRHTGVETSWGQLHAEPLEGHVRMGQFSRLSSRCSPRVSSSTFCTAWGLGMRVTGLGSFRSQSVYTIG